MISRANNLAGGFWLIFLSVQIMASQNTPENNTDPYLFQIHGSNTIGNMLGAELISAYLKSKGCAEVSIDEKPTEQETTLHCNIDTQRMAVRIAAKGSGTGFKAMARGEAHIVASSRRAKPEEAKQLSKYGNILSEQSENIIALDALAIIVNKSNPVENLSINEITKIFKGHYGNWNKVGGRSDSIHLLVRDEASGTRDMFNSLVLGGSGNIYNRHQAFSSNKAISTEVTADTKAIGFTGISSIGQNRALSITVAQENNIPPDNAYISTEDYPLTRKLYFYMPEGINNSSARDFLSFVITDAAQEIIDNNGFVPLGIKQLKQTLPPQSKRYARAIKGYKRLNINIRFTNSNRFIDNFGLQNLRRLAGFMDNNNGSLLLVGFYGLSEGKKARQFSTEKAAKVSKALTNLGVDKTRILIRGIGDQHLLSTGKSLQANRQNIRVEVWYKPWFSGE